MRITLPSGTPAELVVPSTGSPSRGLVVIPDIMGLRPLFDDHCTRLAEENGWAVCAVELFPGQEHLTVEERFTVPSGFDDEAKLADFSAAADATGVEPVGVIGFCMGGMYTFKAAGSGRFDRAVAFYGMVKVPERWAGPGQGEPLDYVSRPGAADVLAIMGGVDHYTPADEVDELEAAGVTVVRYPEADHGFVHDPARPTHRIDDAADAWQRTIDFLRV